MIPHHPRIRGEHHELASGLKNMSGSSPHSRGTHLVAAGILHLPGIIPAFAGNTHFLLSLLHLLEDHPRIRGEHNRQ